MMLYPSIIDLMEKAGSRYSLVIAAAKRARQISEETFIETEVSLDGARSITEAVKEIANGDVEIINSDNNETVEAEEEEKQEEEKLDTEEQNAVEAQEQVID